MESSDNRFNLTANGTSTACAVLTDPSNYQQSNVVLKGVYAFDEVAMALFQIWGYNTRADHPAAGAFKHVLPVF